MEFQAAWSSMHGVIFFPIIIRDENIINTEMNIITEMTFENLCLLHLEKLIQIYSVYVLVAQQQPAGAVRCNIVSVFVCGMIQMCV